MGYYDVAVSSDAAIFRHTLNPKFVSYFFGSKAFFRQKQKFARGFKVTHIKTSDVASFEILVPPLAEQERIVAELDLLTEIIDKQKAQIKELDTLAQSIFYDMFGDPVENEKGWEIQRLGDICNFSQGLQVDVEKQSTVPQEGWYRFLRIVDYTSDNQDVRYIHDNNPKYWISKDDIAMVRYGSVGVVGSDKEGILANNLFRINYPRNCLNKYFLVQLFRTDYFTSFIKKTAFGATMPALSFKTISSFLIYLPPLSLQQSFADKINTIEQQKAAITQSIAETQKLFDYTMDKYFG